MKCPHKLNIQQTTAMLYANEDGVIKREKHTLVEIQSFGDCNKKECACWNEKTNMCERR